MDSNNPIEALKYCFINNIMNYHVLEPPEGCSRHRKPECDVVIRCNLFFQLDKQAHRYLWKEPLLFKYSLTAFIFSSDDILFFIPIKYAPPYGKQFLLFLLST
jgi:hypothetical protein